MVDLEKELRKALEYSEKKSYPEAIRLLTKIIQEYPNSIEGYRERSYVYALMKEWDKALLDISTVINLDSKNAAGYFTRGRWLLSIDNTSDAATDFSTVLMIERESGSSYFSEAAYFFRSLAYLNMELYEKALEDISKVRDNFTVHFKGCLRSKREIEDNAKSKIR